MASRQYVYLAQHNPCIYESEFQTLSVHAREATAEMAIEDDRKRRYKHRLPPAHESWRVVRHTVLP